MGASRCQPMVLPGGYREMRIWANSSGSSPASDPGPVGQPGQLVGRRVGRDQLPGLVPITLARPTSATPPQHWVAGGLNGAGRYTPVGGAAGLGSARVCPLVPSSASNAASSFRKCSLAVDLRS